mmetsp:Transcript_27802/g.43143  ORF Transcript_27802/g.43143 Transcript_27802/m.43143 type:complete len:273 (+) Transcript_27802:282-1100(+)
MLAADKLQLQSALKQQATALKEKEFQLHHSNLMTVGTQAAVLAALDVTMFIEFQAPPDEAWQHMLSYSPRFIFLPRILKFVYYILIVKALCSNITVVANTTILSLNSTGLALRGPDGSMMSATDGLYEERGKIFQAFYMGLSCTMASVLVCVWISLHWEAAFICMFIALQAARKIYQFYQHVHLKFGFDESDTVNFDDLFAGPASIIAVPSSVRKIIGRPGKQKNPRNRSDRYNRVNSDDDSSSSTNSLQRSLRGRSPGNKMGDIELGGVYR